MFMHKCKVFVRGSLFALHIKSSLIRRLTLVLIHIKNIAECCFVAKVSKLI